jgi:hypothetical protein
MSVRVIAAELNSQGISTARDGGRRHLTTVRNVLKRTSNALGRMRRFTSRRANIEGPRRSPYLF